MESIDYKKQNKLILFIFCLVLYPITISRLGLLNYVFIYGVPSAYLVLNFNMVYEIFGKLKIRQLDVWFQIILLIFLSIVLPLMHGTGDYSYFGVTTAIARKIILILFLSILVIKHHGGFPGIEVFMKYYVSATALYVLGSFVFMALPSLRESWRQFLGTNQTIDSLYYTYGYKTRFGWSGFSGFRNTIDCTLSIIFAVNIYFKESSRYLSSFWFYMIISLCFVGNMLYGRIGIIVSAIVFVLALLFYRQIRLKTLVAFSLTSLVFISGIMYLKDRIPIVYEWYDWSLQPIINFIQTGSFDNYSANHLINDMVFMPSLDTFLLGDGRYVEEGTNFYYMRTDSGFMRQVLFWGIGGCFISYLTVLNSLRLLGKKYTIFSLLILVAFAIFEYKGEIYYEIIPIFLILGIWNSYKIDKVKM